MKQSWSILVVDDEAPFLNMMVEFLKGEGYAVVGTVSGQEAVEQMEHNQFAVVLVDLVMSPMGGEDVIELAKKHNPLVEVIVLTGRPTLQSMVDAIRFQVFDYLPKPIDLDRLVRTLENALNQYHLKRENQRIVNQLNKQQDILRERIREVSGELEELSTTDALTGLFNFRYFSEIIQSEISRSLRYKRSLTLAMLDLDHFKHYNDNYGHVKGNEALKAVAEQMRATVREVDILVRYGGEEFAILLPETPKGRARTIVARVCQCVRDMNLKVQTGQGTKLITLSGGLASCPDDAKDQDTLIQNADLALYEAKVKGRDRIVFYTSALREA